MGHFSRAERRSRLYFVNAFRQRGSLRNRFEMLANKHARLRRLRAYAIIVALFALLSCFLACVGSPSSQPVEKNAVAWTEGSMVNGRVIDRHGTAVANAEVLLLGDERIIVDADKRTWFVASTETGQAPTPQSVRTNGHGEFSIARKKGAANRIAVISTDPLFWVVSRRSLGGGEAVEIRLPESGSLAVRCDLPGKPSSQRIMVELRILEDGDKEVDVLRFHFSSFSLTNPGETVFEHLPPGQCAIERYQETPIAANRVLATAADRRLAKVESGRRAAVGIDRKVGRPLTGQVQGLEKVDLSYAYVTINYFGPEERRTYKGRRIRQATAFDVIVVTPEGRFTSDPIPPGKYWLDLFAIRSSTPEGSPQQTDFKGHLDFTIPEKGEMPRIKVLAKPTVPISH
jgi:hypothetical protein